MIISRKSILSGIESSMQINVTHKQLDLWESGVHVQDAMPNLSVGEREFIISGISPNEWKKTFG